MPLLLQFPRPLSPPPPPCRPFSGRTRRWRRTVVPCAGTHSPRASSLPSRTQIFIGMPLSLLHSSHHHLLFTPNSTPSRSSNGSRTRTTGRRAWRRGHSLENPIDAAHHIRPQAACSPWSPCTSLHTRSKSSWRAFSRSDYAADGEGTATPYELDKKKALEALQQLDEQLEALSVPEKKRVPSSRPPDINIDRDFIMGMRTVEAPEISGSYLAYTAVALVLLTIFNNLVFNVFIKPSVDGVEQVSKLQRVPLSDPGEQKRP